MTAHPARLIAATTTPAVTRATTGRSFATREDDLYYGYHGFDDAFFYAWVWSELAYEHDMPVHSLSLVDESGCAVLDVGEGGFSGNSCETLNPEAEFEAPEGVEVTFHSGSEYAPESDPVVDATSGASSHDSSDSGGGGWLDSVFDSFGGDDGSSGSSCGGCSSDW